MCRLGSVPSLLGTCSVLSAPTRHCRAGRSYAAPFGGGIDYLRSSASSRIFLTWLCALIEIKKICAQGSDRRRDRQLVICLSELFRPRKVISIEWRTGA